jgi:threonine dehydrogenase-like Zn-dependent dehydrogenase
MTTSVHGKLNRIGIVGGGKVGLSMLNLFSMSQIATVNFVMDVNPDAPACMAAMEKGIPVYYSIENALTETVDFILEVTGSQKVMELLQKTTEGSGIKLITHDMAYIILAVMEEHSKANRIEVIHEFETINGKISSSSAGIATLLDDIKDVTRGMNFLSINVRIEAARAGNHGKGFAVVAQQMGSSTESVQLISQKIFDVNHSINSTSNGIEKVLQKLQ